MNDHSPSDIESSEQELQDQLDQEEEQNEADQMVNTPFDPGSVDIVDRKITIGNLLERLRNKELNLSPDFQRRANLWDDIRKSRLIESILLRIPLPSFYFSEDADGNYQVVDGLQRLCSIFHFIDYNALNQATGAKLPPLRLIGLQYLKDKNGLEFSELERAFQRRINELEINVNIIRATTHQAVIFNVFARLNQGGLPLTAQEIRNAIYPGPWREYVRRLAEGEAFLRATGGKIPKDRQQDMEMVLRFVALWSLNPPFERPINDTLDKFLNETVAKTLGNWKEAQWLAATTAFEKGLRAAVAIFGRHAFRKSVGQQRLLPLNKVLFEAQTVTLATFSPQEIEKLIARKTDVGTGMARLINKDTGFSAGLRSGTGSAEYTNARIQKIMALFRGAIDA